MRDDVTGHFFVSGERLGLPNMVEVGIPVFGIKGRVWDEAARCAKCGEVAVLWDGEWAATFCRYCGERP